MNAISNTLKFVPQSINGLWLTALAALAIVAGTFVSIFSYIAFILAVLAITLGSEEDALCSMMLLMSFANIFKSTPAAQSFFTYLLLIYVGLYFFRKRYIHKTFLISVGLLFFYVLCQTFVTLNILRTIKFFANILLIYLALNPLSPIKIKKVLLSYIIGVVATSTLSALNIIPNLSLYIGEQSFMQNSVIMTRFTGMYGDPNYYSVNVIISLCLVIILNHRKELSAFLSIPLAVLLVLFVGLTMSKSAFLMLVLPLTLWLYSSSKRRRALVISTACVVGVVIASQLLAGNISLFSGVLDRFSNASDLNSLTTGRYNIWVNYLHFFLRYPGYLIFGQGFGASLLGGHGAHNTYIDMFFYLGFIGTVLLLIVIATLISINKPVFKRTFLNFSVWICIFVMYFFLSNLLYFDLGFHVLIAILASRLNMNLQN